MLQEEGYRVWIDVEQMAGSTLDAMAAGIENASVVLMCASEKYKISPNCRTGKCQHRKYAKCREQISLTFVQ